VASFGGAHRIYVGSVSAPQNYSTATGPLLPDRDALRAVLEYAEEFITTGDIDIMHTLGGGSLLPDGDTVDPAIWDDWAVAWERAASQAHTQGGGVESALLTVQHGFRALHVFLDRYYQPADQTLMSVVRDDCRRALNGDARVWANRLAAVEAGTSADISLRLEPEVSILREVWRRVMRRRGSAGRGSG
jgi:hypothetical protein